MTTLHRTIQATGPLALLLALGLLVRERGFFDLQDPYFSSWDAHYYLAMATRPFSEDPLVHQPPFCWRLLLPLLVSVTPAPPADAFWGWTVLSLAIATTQVQWLVRSLGAPDSAAACASVAFVLLGPLTGYNLHAPYYPDTLSIALILLQLRFCIESRPAWFLAVTLLSALAKESAFLGSIFALAWSLSQNRRMLGPAVASLLIFAATTLTIRSLIPAASDYGFISEFKRIYFPLDLTAQRKRLLAAAGHSWGILLPLMLHGALVRERLRTFAALYAVTFVAYAQLLVAVSIERLVVYAAPAVLVFCTFAVARISRRFNVRPVAIWTAVWLFQIPSFLNHANFFGTHGRPVPRVLTYLAVLWTCLAAVIAFLEVRRFVREQKSPTLRTEEPSSKV